jgi:hypothetical protein
VEGQALLREATALFGPGSVPGESIPTAGESDAPVVDLATIAIMGVLGLLALIVASVVVASIGRGGRETESRS